MRSERVGGCTRRTTLPRGRGDKLDSGGYLRYSVAARLIQAARRRALLLTAPKPVPLSGWGSRLFLFTEIPRETVRKGAGVAPRLRFLLLQDGQTGLLRPVSLLRRTRLWDFSDSFSTKLGRCGLRGTNDG